MKVRAAGRRLSYLPSSVHFGRTAGTELGPLYLASSLRSSNRTFGRDVLSSPAFSAASNSTEGSRHHSTHISHHTVALPEGPLSRYETLVKSKQIKDDPAQRQALQHLQQLFERLIQKQNQPHRHHSGASQVVEDNVDEIEIEEEQVEEVVKPKETTSAASGGGWFSKFFGSGEDNSSKSASEVKKEKEGEQHKSKKRHVRAVPQETVGVYLYGDVGCGKTFVMDLFHDSIPFAKKRRVHFNAFMLDVHSKIHQWRYKRRMQKEEQMEREREKRARGETPTAQAEDSTHNDSGDPLPPLAKDLAAAASILCFDEFQVTDVADAMILHRLFSLMFSHGVVVVATSNRAPNELYKGGLQRDRFLPFIDLLHKRCIVHKFNSGLDYRLRGQRTLGVYHIQHKKSEANPTLEKIFTELTQPETPKTASLNVGGRRLFVPKVARGVAWFTFDELCRQALGAADYIVLSKEYHTVILSDIPKMNLNHKSEARRFITLVDELYNHKVKVICSAEAEAEKLFSGDEGHDEDRQSNIYDELSGTHLGTIWNGEEEKFMFNRAVSRLTEMQSSEYLQSPHKPDQ